MPWLNSLLKFLCGFGLFGLMCGGGDTPEYNPPAAPKLKTADEIYQEAIQFALKNYPQAYGARESALADIGRGTEFYKGFQPTSFEEALGTQGFQNIWPDTQRQIAQAYSLSGLEGSPGLATTMGKEYGNLATTIGEYLSNLGQSRAQYSLQSRLGIDPNAVTSPYAQTNINQSNQQAQLDYEASVARAQADYQNALAKTKEKQSKVTGLMTIGGAIAGTMLFPGAGGLLPGALGWGTAAGAGAGAMASPLFGGGQSPISFSDALAMSQYPQQQKTQDIFNKYLQGITPTAGTTTAGAVQPVNTSNLFQQPSLSDWTKGQSSYNLFG